MEGGDKRREKWGGVERQGRGYGEVARGRETGNGVWGSGAGRGCHVEMIWTPAFRWSRIEPELTGPLVTRLQQPACAPLRLLPSLQLVPSQVKRFESTSARMDRDSDSDTDTDRDFDRDRDTRTHEHTDTQTHRRTDTRATGRTNTQTQQPTSIPPPHTPLTVDTCSRTRNGTNSAT